MSGIRCGAIWPLDQQEPHCTCKYDSGHNDSPNGNHRCYGCGFEWPLDNVIEALGR